MSSPRRFCASWLLVLIAVSNVVMFPESCDCNCNSCYWHVFLELWLQQCKNWAKYHYYYVIVAVEVAMEGATSPAFIYTWHLLVTTYELEELSDHCPANSLSSSGARRCDTELLPAHRNWGSPELRPWLRHNAILVAEPRLWTSNPRIQPRRRSVETKIQSVVIRQNRVTNVQRLTIEMWNSRDFKNQNTRSGIFDFAQ